jgi:hypothetical protein
LNFLGLEEEAVFGDHAFLPGTRAC